MPKLRCNRGTRETNAGPEWLDPARQKDEPLRVRRESYRRAFCGTWETGAWEPSESGRHRADSIGSVCSESRALAQPRTQTLEEVEGSDAISNEVAIFPRAELGEHRTP